jgi:hypothetical protein
MQLPLAALSFKKVQPSHTLKPRTVAEVPFILGEERTCISSWFRAFSLHVSGA